MLIENEFVIWIKEIKGLCFARTRVHCSSWQLGKLPPSAGCPLPPSAGQPAISASCLLCVSVGPVGGVRQSMQLISVYPGFAKTMTEWGCCRWCGEVRNCHHSHFAPLKQFQDHGDDFSLELRYSCLMWKDVKTQIREGRWKGSASRRQLSLQESCDSEKSSSRAITLGLRPPDSASDTNGEAPLPCGHSCLSSKCPLLHLLIQGVNLD